MPKKKQYADTPSAPASKIADKPLIQNSSLGNKDLPMIPAPRASGPPIGGITRAPKFGKLRVSGHPSAHHIGKK